MKSSYRQEEVTLLLKDITGLVEPLENEQREVLIQSGVHYSEMLPREHLPTPAYRQAFEAALQRYALPTARAVERLGDAILADKGEEAALVSLARAGTTVGVLLRRYLRRRYGVQAPHYTISIIRGRGIDQNAMKTILSRHPADKVQFVDGWTGKRAIRRQLRETMKDFPGVDDRVGVLSDPAFVAGFYGTRSDFLIPSSCLNSTVSGLISRTFYRKDLIGPQDYHGAYYYGEFEAEDLTNRYLDTIEAHFGESFSFVEPAPQSCTPMEEVQSIAETCGIEDINFVKPGIGEATRVLLRRIPWKILVHSLHDPEYLGHIYQLAEEKQIPLEVYPLQHYKACGLIKKLADV